MLKEFKEFISRGNLIEIAVAFVMGVAFSAVVSTLTQGIVTPLIGRIFKIERLQDWIVGGDVALGAFLAAILNFVVVGFVMFMVVKAYNRFKTPAAAPDQEPSEEIVLLRDIRDSLKK